MKIWIVWTYICKSKNDDYIFGIYLHKKSALKVCNDNNRLLLDNYECIKKSDIKDDNNGLLVESDNENDIYYCSRIECKKGTEKIYFMYINELCGAESYGHGRRWIHVNVRKNKLISIAKEIFDAEHNDDRSHDKEKMVHELKKNNMTEFDCDNVDSPYINFEICAKNI